MTYSDNRFYAELAGLCELFLHNYSHISRVDRTEQIIREMKKLLGVYPDAPPALGVQAAERVDAKDKAG